jgi:chromosome segregation ATPase
MQEDMVGLTAALQQVQATMVDRESQSTQQASASSSQLVAAMAEIEKLRAELRSTDEARRSLEASLTETRSAATSQLAEAQSAIRAAETKAHSMATELQNMRSTSTAAAEETSRLEAELRTAMSQLEQLQGQLQLVQSSFERKQQELVNASTQIDGLMQELSSTRAQVASLSAASAAASSTVSNSAAAQGELQALVADYAGKLSQAQSQLEGEREAAARAMSEASSTYAAAKQALEQSNAHLEASQKEAAAAFAELSDARNRIATLENMLSEAREALIEAHENSNRQEASAAVSQEKIAAMTSAIAEMEASIRALQADASAQQSAQFSKEADFQACLEAAEHRSQQMELQASELHRSMAEAREEAARRESEARNGASIHAHSMEEINRLRTALSAAEGRSKQAEYVFAEFATAHGRIAELEAQVTELQGGVDGLLMDKECAELDRETAVLELEEVTEKCAALEATVTELQIAQQRLTTAYGALTAEKEGLASKLIDAEVSLASLKEEGEALRAAVASMQAIVSSAEGGDSAMAVENDSAQRSGSDTSDAPRTPVRVRPSAAAGELVGSLAVFSPGGVPATPGILSADAAALSVLKEHNLKLRNALARLKHVAEGEKADFSTRLTEASSLAARVPGLEQEMQQAQRLIASLETELQEAREQLQVASDHAALESLIEQLTVQNQESEVRLIELAGQVEEYERMRLVDEELEQHHCEYEAQLRREISTLETAKQSLEDRLRTVFDAVGVLRMVAASAEQTVKQRTEEVAKLREALAKHMAISQAYDSSTSAAASAQRKASNGLTLVEALRKDKEAAQLQNGQLAARAAQAALDREILLGLLPVDVAMKQSAVRRFMRALTSVSSRLHVMYAMAKEQSEELLPFAQALAKTSTDTAPVDVLFETLNGLQLPQTDAFSRTTLSSLLACALARGTRFVQACVLAILLPAESADATTARAERVGSKRARSKGPSSMAATGNPAGRGCMNTAKLSRFLELIGPALLEMDAELADGEQWTPSRCAPQSPSPGAVVVSKISKAALPMATSLLCDRLGETADATTTDMLTLSPERILKLNSWGDRLQQALNDMQLLATLQVRTQTKLSASQSPAVQGFVAMPANAPSQSGGSIDMLCEESLAMKALSAVSSTAVKCSNRLVSVIVNASTEISTLAGLAPSSAASGATMPARPQRGRARTESLEDIDELANNSVCAGRLLVDLQFTHACLSASSCLVAAALQRLITAYKEVAALAKREGANAELAARLMSVLRTLGIQYAGAFAGFSSATSLANATVHGVSTVLAKLSSAGPMLLSEILSQGTGSTEQSVNMASSYIGVSAALAGTTLLDFSDGSTATVIMDIALHLEALTSNALCVLTQSALSFGSDGPLIASLKEIDALVDLLDGSASTSDEEASLEGLVAACKSCIGYSGSVLEESSAQRALLRCQGFLSSLHSAFKYRFSPNERMQDVAAQLPLRTMSLLPSAPAFSTAAIFISAPFLQPSDASSRSADALGPALTIGGTGSISVAWAKELVQVRQGLEDAGASTQALTSLRTMHSDLVAQSATKERELAEIHARFTALEARAAQVAAKASEAEVLRTQALVLADEKAALLADLKKLEASIASNGGALNARNRDKQATRPGGTDSISVASSLPAAAAAPAASSALKEALCVSRGEIASLRSKLFALELKTIVEPIVSDWATAQAQDSSGPGTASAAEQAFPRVVASQARLLIAQRRVPSLKVSGLADDVFHQTAAQTVEAMRLKAQAEQLGHEQWP